MRRTSVANQVEEVATVVKLRSEELAAELTELDRAHHPDRVEEVRELAKDALERLKATVDELYETLIENIEGCLKMEEQKVKKLAHVLAVYEVLDDLGPGHDDLKKKMLKKKELVRNLYVNLQKKWDLKKLIDNDVAHYAKELCEPFTPPLSLIDDASVGHFGGVTHRRGAGDGGGPPHRRTRAS